MSASVKRSPMWTCSRKDRQGGLRVWAAPRHHQENQPARRIVSRSRIASAPQLEIIFVCAGGESRLASASSSSCVHISRTRRCTPAHAHPHGSAPSPDEPTVERHSACLSTVAAPALCCGNDRSSVFAFLMIGRHRLHQQRLPPYPLVAMSPDPLIESSPEPRTRTLKTTQEQQRKELPE